MEHKTGERLAYASFFYFKERRIDQNIYHDEYFLKITFDKLRHKYYNHKVNNLNIYFC